MAVDFQKYQNFLPNFKPFPSVGQFMECDFICDTAYYLNEPFHAFAQLFKVDGMQFVGCNFDNSHLPFLPGSLADFGFGIYSVSSGFGVYANSSAIIDRPCVVPCIEYRRSAFKGLGHGIYIMTLDKNRLYSVYNADFDNCFRGLTSISTTGGTIVHNNFNLGIVPDENFSYGQIGAEFHFDHNGFVMQENKFEVTEDETEVISLGLLCNKLGAFDNEIRRDSFINLNTSNQSFGENADDNIFVPRGLQYLCNVNENTIPYGYDFHIPNSPAIDMIHPFQTPGASNGSIVATGNQFAYSSSDFINYGEKSVGYWYYPQGLQEEPRDSFVLGITKDLGIQGFCESEYCAPPCIEDIGIVKEDYYSNIVRFYAFEETYLAAKLLDLHPKTEQSLSSAIYFRRLASKNAYDVVTHLLIDTSLTNTDSLIKWLGYIDTYGADLMIAGEFASKYDYQNALDVLETISIRRVLSEREYLDLNSAIYLYSILAQKSLQNLTPLEMSNTRVIAYSNTGIASGLARGILANWGEYAPLPYYIDQQIHFRQDSKFDSTNVNINMENESLKIFPNPALDNINIEWEIDKIQPDLIFVVNLFGVSMKQIDVGGESNIKLDINDLNEGMYLIVARSLTGSIITKRLIVLRN